MISIAYGGTLRNDFISQAKFSLRKRNQPAVFGGYHDTKDIGVGLIGAACTNRCTSPAEVRSRIKPRPNSARAQLSVQTQGGLDLAGGRRVFDSTAGLASPTPASPRWKTPLGPGRRPFETTRPSPS